MSEHKQTLLIVDDHLPTRLIGDKTLKKEGFEVFTASNAKDGLALFDEIRPDLLLLDVIMPGMDGYEMCQALRRHEAGQNTPILMLTGLDDMESIDKAYTVGATDFVTKPVNWQILSHRLKYMLRANDAFTEVSGLNKKLLENESRLANAQRIAKLGNWEYNLETKDFICSNVVLQIYDLEEYKESLSINVLLDMIHKEEGEDVVSSFLYATKNKTPWISEHRIIRKDGVESVLKIRSEFRHEKESNEFILSGTVQDVTEQKNAESQIRQMAYFDSLTGLPNRLNFKEKLNEKLIEAKRYHKKFALLFLDLDRFKIINDTLGHSMGDELLKQVSKRLKNCIRDSDSLSRYSGENSILARFGGDEFTLLALELNENIDATKVATRILEQFDTPLYVNGHKIFTSTSIGISIFPDDGSDVDTLLKNADLAMYHSKKIGQNTFHYFSEEMNKMATEKLVIENNLRHALENDEMRAFYQPKVNRITSKVHGVELLLRWENATLGEVSPDTFIPIAEESGLIIPIGNFILQTACDLLKKWKNSDKSELQVSVNVSSIQFKQKDFVQNLSEFLQTHDVNPELLEIEITENAMMEDADNVVEKLKNLKKLGVDLAIDDFGTGYSSLSYLKKFPIDRLKIDKSFIKDVVHNHEDAAICKAILSMARNLNMQVTAEGLEEHAQLEFLQNKGCDEFQGFYFSKPVSLDDLDQVIDEISAKFSQN